MPLNAEKVSNVTLSTPAGRPSTGRSNDVPVFSTLCRYFSLLIKKLRSFVTMRRLLTRVLNRVLLSGPVAPAMRVEAEMHTEGRRRLVSERAPHICIDLHTSASTSSHLHRVHCSVAPVSNLTKRVHTPDGQSIHPIIYV